MGVIQIQKSVSRLPLGHIDEIWSWEPAIDELIERADLRIRQNGYFDAQKVEQVKCQKVHLKNCFSQVKPIAYLDDISTKNLLIHNGQISGIIDIDWIGVGDSLTFIAMTYVALLNMNYDTDYIAYLPEERGCSDEERLFCSILCCTVWILWENVVCALAKKDSCQCAGHTSIKSNI